MLWQPTRHALEIKWDNRFLALAALVASWSKDTSTKVGACIVAPNRTVVSMGYNGFPRSMRDDDSLYTDREQKLSRVIHAEMNALLFAPRIDLAGHTLYTSLMPCDRCFVHMVQAGITRFVYPRAPESALERWREPFDRVRQYAAEMGIELVEVTG